MHNIRNGIVIDTEFTTSIYYLAKQKPKGPAYFNFCNLQLYAIWSINSIVLISACFNCNLLRLKGYLVKCLYQFTVFKKNLYKHNVLKQLFIYFFYFIILTRYFYVRYKFAKIRYFLLRSTISCHSVTGSPGRK